MRIRKCQPSFSPLTRNKEQKEYGIKRDYFDTNER